MNPKKLLIFLLLLTLPAESLLAASGILTLNRGLVKIQDGTKTRILTRKGSKYRLTEKDHVHTGKNTQVQVSLKGKSEIITLYSNSFFTIDKLTSKQSDLAMLAGKGRFKIRPNKRRKRFRMRTSTAIVSVKGTEFLVSSTEAGTDLLTVTGVVTMASVDTPDVEVPVKKDQISRTEKGRQPTKPITVPPKVRNTILKAVATKEKETFKGTPFQQKEEKKEKIESKKEPGDKKKKGEEKKKEEKQKEKGKEKEKNEEKQKERKPGEEKQKEGKSGEERQPRAAKEGPPPAGGPAGPPPPGGGPKQPFFGGPDEEGGPEGAGEREPPPFFGGSDEEGGFGDNPPGQGEPPPILGPEVELPDEPIEEPDLPDDPIGDIDDIDDVIDDAKETGKPRTIEIEIIN